MTKLTLSFKDHIKSYILKNSLFKPNHNSKYSIDQILDAIEYLLITGASWRSFNLPVFKASGIKWQSIRHHFDKFTKANVFQNVYKILLSKYFTTNKSNKLKYLSIDASFIKNQYASNVGFNGFCKKKKWSKLSLIVDANGVPISSLLVKGNKADCSLFIGNINNIMIDISYKSNNNKHKRYFMADSAYDNSKIRENITNKNIKPIIWYIRRHRIDKTKNKKFTKKETKIYNKRIIIENCFSWLFQNRRINKRYDKKTINYKSFMFMAFIKILLRRM